MLLIRDVKLEDIEDIENMVNDFVLGHPAANQHRPRENLIDAYISSSPVSHLLVAERNGQVIGMGQWKLMYDMFWGFYGAEAEWLYVSPKHRGSGVAAAIIAHICNAAREKGAQYLHGGSDERLSKLYERVAIGGSTRECHLSGEAFQVFADLAGSNPRNIVRGLPSPNLGNVPARIRGN